MRQEGKASEIAHGEYTFKYIVPADDDTIHSMAEQVASQIRIPLRGRLLKRGENTKNDTRFAVFALMGPGSFVEVATMSLMTFPHKGETVVYFQLEDFMYQPGSLWSKPTLNGAKQLTSFVEALKVEFDLLGAKR